MLFSFDGLDQEKVLRGIATDGHRNPLLAINVMIKGTAIGTVTDQCGRFSIPLSNEELTLVFHGMSYDDLRAFEIALKSSECINDTIVFQLGNWKVDNPACNKVSNRLIRHHIN